MKRWVDLILACVLLVLTSPLLVAVATAVRLTSPGPVLHWSRRVGRRGVVFAMPKFRTMRTDTPEVPTHLLDEPERWITPVGGLLRRTSVDELPQLWSIAIGQMSFVGPRPALPSQTDLLRLREAGGVDRVRPGLTGWAQVNGRDELPIARKAELDAEYVRRQGLLFDLQVIAMTASKATRAEGVREGRAAA